MKKIIILSTVAVMSLNAASFQSIGYKSISMGGASVSNAKGDMAIYSNPALLGDNDDNFNVSIGGGLTIDDNGAAKAINDINELNFVQVFDQVTENANLSNLNSLDLIKKSRDIMIENDNASFSINPHAHFFLQTSNLGLGVVSTTDLKGKLNIDTSKTKLIVWSDANNNGLEDNLDLYTNLENATYDANGLISSLGNSTYTEYTNESLFKDILDEKNNVAVKAVNITEVPLAYGHMFNPGDSQLMVGLAAKFLMGNTYVQSLEVGRNNTIDILENDYTTTHTYGVDVGLAYRNGFIPNLTFGAVAKNINTPTFEVKGDVDYELKPSAKAGISYTGSWFELAVDSDLTKNETFNGLEQIVGGGVAISPWDGTSFRAGVKSNLANENSDLIYTAGIGLGFKWISLDVAGEFGGKDVIIENKTVKEHMGIAINLVSRF